MTKLYVMLILMHLRRVRGRINTDWEFSRFFFMQIQLTY